MHVSISAEQIFSIFSFPITNSLIVAWIVMIVLAIFSLLATRNMRLVPQGVQNTVEAMIEGMIALFDSITHDRALTKKIFPLVGSIFIVVVLINWTGLLPGVGTIGINEVSHEGTRLVPFFRASSADLNFTLALALVSVVMIQVWSIGALGLGGYRKKFISFKGPIEFLVGILEIISEAIKVVSFSFRLFGNIFAGEVLLTVVLSLIYYIAPVPVMLLEFGVGLIQGAVFALLTVVFVTLARQEAH